MKSYRNLLRFAALAAALCACMASKAITLYSTVDRHSVDAASLLTWQPSGTYFYGAHEDNGGLRRDSDPKPIWHAGVFMTASQDSSLGQVSIPINARQASNLRLEIYRTAGVGSSFSTWTFLGQDVLGGLTGKKWFDFDLSSQSIGLDAGSTYAFNIVVDAVGGRWTAQSFDWLIAPGLPVSPGYESYFRSIAQHTKVPNASFGSYIGLGGRFGIHVESLMQSETRSVPDASSSLALFSMALPLLALGIRRRAQTIG